ncbi:phosphoadenylyl-sulfate reductase [Salinivirga cyanobacteriivorans]|uniref:Adenosine 5'-phosphosulfate reductase n=1 Tax=Salinivirga cyanobacteriivorans TaxID=1307839 RepID=A0A0S2I599_9BACT|nr:phosphoadenylyl-sulfate reductase [Salinivirga cyanobacteriivorans]ALO17132.1 Phosphoadenosine phosphosulfate reductase [Salinivirga cyanobacteriivorans]
MDRKEIERVNEKLAKADARETLDWAIERFGADLVLSSSMGAEDQVLTDMLMKKAPSVEVFTLDTGRLFPETYQLIDETNEFYKTKIKIYFPDYKQVEEMVNNKGVNLFYHSVENRKMCCHIRKIEPLKRAFSGRKAWISGLRREQSITRTEVQRVEWDEANGLVKINPLIDWKEDQVWDYITVNHVPYHKLHDKGYPSIGCQPCTRAVKPGEDVRAGRWWWEDPEHKECGLHVQDDLKTEVSFDFKNLDKK